MAFKIVEYYIRSVLSDSIARLRNDLDELDHVFGDLLCPPLDQVYGRKLLDEIKCFFRDNDVPVLAAMNQNSIQLPSVTVHLLSSQEDQEFRTFQDHWEYERIPTKASVVAGPIYGTSYDSSTGRIVFAKTVDLSQAIKGRKIYSARNDTVYTIKGTMKTNTPGTATADLKDQYVTIVDASDDIPESVDIAELSILSSIDFALYRKASVQYRETFEIRVNANANSDQAIWLYYIIAYIFMRNKQYFEEVGLESQTFGTSEFTRDVGKMPNNIWGRTLRMNFLVWHTWREPLQALELVGINLNAEDPITGDIQLLTQE